MTMQTDALIALGAGGFAVVLALLAIILSSMARSAAGRAERELEASRQESTRAEAARWLLDRELESAARLQTRAIHAIGRLKDEITRCAGGESGPPDHETALKGISEAGRRLASLYEEIHAQLGRADRAALHRARERGLEILYRARTALEDLSDAGHLAEADRAALLQQRADLGELQDVVRDSRAEKLLSRAIRASGAGGSRTGTAEAEAKE